LSNKVSTETNTALDQGFVEGQGQKAGAPTHDWSRRNRAGRYGIRGKWLHELAVAKRWCSSFPRLRRLRCECRNFQKRIRIVWSNSDSYRVPMGFLYLESSSGCVYENIRGNGRSECIERFASTQPWATPFDWNLYREAWDQGVEWALHNLDFDSPSISEHKALLASELAYKGPCRSHSVQCV